jgi:hypothetical protein
MLQLPDSPGSFQFSFADPGMKDGGARFMVEHGARTKNISLHLFLCQHDHHIFLGEGDDLTFQGIGVYTKGVLRILFFSPYFVPDSRFTQPAGAFDYRGVINRLAKLHVVFGWLQVNLASIRVEQVIENRHQIGIFRQLRHKDGNEMVAHDEVIDLGHGRQVTVADIIQFRHNVEIGVRFLLDCAEVE